MSIELDIQQGDSWSKSFQFKTSTGLIIDLSGCVVHVQFKSFYGVIYADLTMGSGVVIDGTRGTVTLSMTAEQTSLLAMRQLYWDMDLLFPTGEASTIISGTSTVNFQVTAPDIGTAVLDFTNSENSGLITLLLL
jgi:hypothetical protein